MADARLANHIIKISSTFEEFKIILERLNKYSKKMFENEFEKEQNMDKYLSYKNWGCECLQNYPQFSKLKVVKYPKVTQWLCSRLRTTFYDIWSRLWYMIICGEGLTNRKTIKLINYKTNHY